MELNYGICSLFFFLKETPLLIATLLAYTDLVTFLVESGANVNAKNEKRVWLYE